LTTCPHCGAENADEPSSCSSCGKYLKVEQASERNHSRVSRARRLIPKLPKKTILLAAAVVSIGAVYGLVRQYHGGVNPSAQFSSNWMKGCLAGMEEESEPARQYCDCVWGGLMERYSIGQLEEMEKEMQASQDGDYSAYSESPDLTDECIRGWTGSSYPNTTRKAFVRQCIDDAGDQAQAQCECLLQQLEENYSVSEFLKMNTEIEQNPGFVPPALATVVARCQ
jgi:hypothetical protein